MNYLSKVFINNSPIVSIYGGIDGLKHFRDIIYNSTKVLKENGMLILQTNEYQIDKIINILKNTNRYKNIIFLAGSSCLPRFILCEKK